MAKISSKDIADLTGLIDQIHEAIEAAEGLKKALVDDVKGGIKELKNINPVDSKSVKEFTAAQEKLTSSTKNLNSVNAKRKALADEEIRLQKQLLKAKAQNNKAQQTTSKRLAVEREKRKALNKEIRQQAKVSAGLTNAYDRESMKLNELRRQYKGLAAEGKANTRQAREMLAEIGKLDAKLKGIDSNVGQFQRNVGNYGSAWDRVKGTFKSVRNQAALAVTSIIGLNKAMQGIRGSVDAAKEFEASFTNVLTLLSSDDVSKFGGQLEAGSIKLVEEYGFAIEDVNKALFDAISAGVPAGDAIKFLNESAKLSIGGVTTLGVAVDGTTSVLNAYKLGVDQTATVQDAFFSAQKAGKTTVEELSGAIGQIAPIAANAKIPFQDLLAAVSTLTTGGLSTDEATTSLKGLLVSLQKPTTQAVESIEKLNEELGTNIPTSVSELRSVGLGAALADISKAGEANADVISELFPNVRALTAAFALGGEGLETYNDILNQVTNDTGEASSRIQAFETQQLTAAQKSKKLNGEIKALQVEIGQKLLPIINQIKQGFISFVKFIGRNRHELARLLTVVGSAILAYKAFVTVQKIQNREIVVGSRLQKSYAVTSKLLAAAKALLTGNIGRANAAMKTLNKTFKFSPVGILISGMTALAATMIDFGGEADLAAAKQERLNKAMERGKQIAEAQNKAVDKNITEFEKEGQARIEDAIAADASPEEINKIRQEVAQENINNIEQEVANIQRLADKDKERINRLESIDSKMKENSKTAKKVREETFLANVKELGSLQASELARKKENKILEKNKKLFAERKKIIKEGGFGGQFSMLEDGETIKGSQGSIEERNKKIEELMQKRLDLQTELNTLEIEGGTISNETSKAQQEAAKRRLKDLELLKKRLEDIRNERIKDEEEREIAKTKTKFNREIAEIKGNSEIERNLRIELERQMSLDILEIQEKFREKRKKEELDFEKRTVEELTVQRKLNNQKFIENETERRIQNEIAEKDALEELIKIYENHGENVEQLELDLLQKQERIAELKAKRIAEINKQNLDQELKQISDSEKKKELELLRNADLTQEQIQKKVQENRIKALEAEIEARRAAGEKDLTDLEIQLEKEKRKQKEDARQAEIEATKQFYETMQSIADAFAERQRKRDEEQIRRIDEQIAAVRKRQDTFRALAESGDLDAQKSIAAEIKREEKLQKEKERIQRQAANRELFLSAFKTYSSKVEAGDPTPVQSTIRDLAFLSAAVSGLQTFYDGTQGDQTIGEMLGSPHLNTTRDQYVVRVDKDERILNPGQSKRLKGYTNDQIADIVEGHKRGMSATPFEAFEHERVYTYNTHETQINHALNTVTTAINSQRPILKKIADKPVYLGRDFDKTAKAVAEIVKMNGRTERIVKKLSDVNW